MSAKTNSSSATMKATRAWTGATGLSFALLCFASVHGQPSPAQVVNPGEDSKLIELTSGPNLLRIEQKTGRIALLSAGERTLLGGARGRGPFRLHLPLPDFESHMVEAHKTRPKVEASGGRVLLTYENLIGKRGSVDVNAQVTIRSAQDGGFELSCRIHNGTQIKIPQVFFPWISGFGKIDADADQITFGHSTFKPWQAWHAPPDPP